MKIFTNIGQVTDSTTEMIVESMAAGSELAKAAHEYGRQVNLTAKISTHEAYVEAITNNPDIKAYLLDESNDPAMRLAALETSLAKL